MRTHDVPRELGTFTADQSWGWPPQLVKLKRIPNIIASFASNRVEHQPVDRVGTQKLVSLRLHRVAVVAHSQNEKDVALLDRMLACLQKSAKADNWDTTNQRNSTIHKISKVAREVYKSTEDLCKSTTLYKFWDTRQMMKQWRHAAWALLRDHGVLCAIWLDEVVAFHGGDIATGDYYLVVQDPVVAAGCLSIYGYRPISRARDSNPISRFHCQQVKMSAPGALVDVVLLAAEEWCYDLSTDALHDDLCPYLPEFVDAMIAIWLRVPVASYNINANLMRFLAAMIHDCYRLSDFGERVCSNAYSMWLKAHHREVHFDIVARSKGLVKSKLDFQSRHKYHVHKSNLIRQGKFSAQPRRARAFKLRLPVLVETPEDTKPMMKSGRGPFVISATSITVFPSYNEIGIAL